MSKYLFKLYFFFYLITIFMSVNWLLKTHTMQYHTMKFYSWLIYLLIRGFPPTFLFICKIELFMNLWKIFSLVFFVIILILVVGIIIRYLNLVWTYKLNKSTFIYTPSLLILNFKYLLFSFLIACLIIF